MNNSILLMPDKTLFIAAIAYLLLGCGAFFSETLFLVWFLSGLCLLPVIAVDAILLVFFTERFTCGREIPVSLAQGEEADVTLYIRRGTPRFLMPSFMLVYDLYPASIKTDAFPAALVPRKIDGNRGFIFRYAVQPVDRGPWFFSGIRIMEGSPLRFWRMRITHDTRSRGRTYPDFKKLAEGAELRSYLERGDVKEIRKRGQGMEFESLRDYQQGDSLRSIDWRATSRSRRMDGGYKFIVRNYQEEQEQQVLFILDSGYRLPDYQFDNALNAMLLLSYMALKHGDAVAAASFGASERWIPPRKGMSSLTGLMNGLYDLHSAPVPSSPFSALENALARLHRRSLIILISNFSGEDDEALSWILPGMAKRHMLLMVSFRENEAEQLAFPKMYSKDAGSPSSQPAVSAEQTLETAAAFSYLESRRRLYRTWEHNGILVLETAPQRISADLINRYLSIKRAGKL
jgi:uncharacterized protein (DUF58 family)